MYAKSILYMYTIHMHIIRFHGNNNKFSCKNAFNDKTTSETRFYNFQEMRINT
jgi:hypothetical protein